MSLRMNPIPPRPDLDELLRKSVEAFKSMSPEKQAEMIDAQRQSWVRGMTAPCEHGVLDFEQCPECRGWSRDDRSDP